MVKIVCTVFCFLLSMAVNEIAAQTAIQFTPVTTKDGLSGNVVYSLFQDSKGFLWIGTHRGLNRYDGYHFRHYLYDPTDSNSISSTHVHCIKEHAKGLLWLTTFNGLNSLNPATGEVKRFFPKDKSLSTDFKDMMLVDDSLLLMVSPSGILVFNTHNKQFNLINIAEGDNRVHEYAKFTKNKKEEIYIQTFTENFLLIDYKNNKATSVPAEDFKKDFSDKHISGLYFDRDDFPWISFLSSFKLLMNAPSKSTNSTTLVLQQSGNYKVPFFYEDKNNKIWICSFEGLLMYDYRLKQFSRFQYEPANPASLSNNYVTNILCDKNNVYWVATFGSGLCRFQLSENSFKHINLPGANGSANNMVAGIRTIKSGSITGRFANRNSYFSINEAHEASVLDAATITLPSLLYEITGEQLKNFSKKEQHFLEVRSKYLCCIYNSNLLVDKNRKTWIIEDSIYTSDTSIFTEKRIEKIIADEEGNFIAATDKGVLPFNIKSMQFKKSSIGLADKYCKDILPDGNGNYWVATANDGLAFWNTVTDNVQFYTIKDGLPDNSLYMILSDKKGRLWISTNNGLSCFDTTGKIFTNFTLADGLVNTEYNTQSACIDRKGYMYFGGMNGLDYFNPDSIDTKKQPPSLQLSSFKVFDKIKQLQTSYLLATGENNITIEFTGNDFLSAPKISYRYKLSGADNDWLTLQGTNSVTYNKLPHGYYQFAVQSSYDNKKWSSPLLINITIATPWYKTWWFYSLIVLTITSVVYLLFRYRLQQKLKVLQIRNRLHRDLHDDVGATLSSVKAYSEILKNNPDNPIIAELIQNNSAEMIERLEVIAWATNPQHDNFKSLKNSMIKFATPLCHSKQILCNIESLGIKEEMQIPGDVRQNIFLVFKEAINNMIKYAGATTCNTKLFILNNHFILQITDNGKGVDGTTKGSGNGWKNMKKRAEGLNGKLLIESALEKGVVITMELPYPFKIPNSWDRNKV